MGGEGERGKKREGGPGEEGGGETEEEGEGERGAQRKDSYKLHGGLGARRKGAQRRDSYMLHGKVALSTVWPLGGEFALRTVLGMGQIERGAREGGLE